MAAEREDKIVDSIALPTKSWKARLGRWFLISSSGLFPIGLLLLCYCPHWFAVTDSLALAGTLLSETSTSRILGLVLVAFSVAAFASDYHNKQIFVKHLRAIELQHRDGEQKQESLSPGEAEQN